MQRFSPKNHLTARTRFGVRLGRVTGVEIDELTGRIATFFVSPTRVLSALLESEMAVAWGQVIEWSGDEITVSDAAVPAGATNLAFVAPSAPSAHLSQRT